MTETTWSQQLEILRNEVALAAQSFYMWKHINNYAATNPSVLKNMQQNPVFWNTMVYALQETFIMTIGRVFDKDSRSNSIQKFLKEMASNSDYFSKENLKRRKYEATSGGDTSWVADYVRGAWEPTTSDLEQIRDTINPMITKYTEIYEPIRNKMFAHNDIVVDVGALLGKTLISDIEEILYTLHDILEKVWNIFTNGIRPTLERRKYDDELRIKKTTLCVMKELNNN